MKVKSNAIINGFADFLTHEIRPQYPKETMGSFMMGFSSGLIKSRAETVTKKLMGNPLISMFVIEEDGMIDLDAVIEAAQEAMPENGLKVAIPFSGDVTFHRSDAAIIRQYIERASG